MVVAIGPKLLEELQRHNNNTKDSEAAKVKKFDIVIEKSEQCVEQQMDARIWTSEF